MAEQLAENYHNTWGRKKKMELQSKGEWFCFIWVWNTESERFGFSKPFWVSFFVQEVERILCWCPMILWQQKKRHETERRHMSCWSSYNSTDMLSQGNNAVFHVSIILYIDWSKSKLTKYHLLRFKLLTDFRGLKDMESDISSIEKRFAYGFLQKLLKWMEIAQEFIAHLGIVGQRWKNWQRGAT